MSNCDEERDLNALVTINASIESTRRLGAFWLTVALVVTEIVLAHTNPEGTTYVCYAFIVAMFLVCCTPSMNMRATSRAIQSSGGIVRHYTYMLATEDVTAIDGDSFSVSPSDRPRAFCGMTQAESDRVRTLKSAYGDSVELALTKYSDGSRMFHVKNRPGYGRSD